MMMTEFVGSAAHRNVAAVSDGTAWRQQSSRLWVGRCDGRCVGTIERGSQFVYLDLDGVARCAHRTLADAQWSHAASGSECMAFGLVDLDAGHGPLILSVAAAVITTVLFVLTVVTVF